MQTWSKMEHGMSGYSQLPIFMLFLHDCCLSLNSSCSPDLPIFEMKLWATLEMHSSSWLCCHPVGMGTSALGLDSLSSKAASTACSGLQCSYQYPREVSVGARSLDLSGTGVGCVARRDLIQRNHQCMCCGFALARSFMLLDDCSGSTCTVWRPPLSCCYLTSCLGVGSEGSWAFDPSKVEIIIIHYSQQNKHESYWFLAYWIQLSKDTVGRG